MYDGIELATDDTRHLRTVNYGYNVQVEPKHTYPRELSQLW